MIENSPVSTDTGRGLDERGSIPDNDRYCVFATTPRPVLGPHPIFYVMRTEDPLHGGGGQK